MNTRPKVCLITGATSGIGRATALALARTGARLLLTGRNVRGGQQVVRACRHAGNGADAVFIRADLGSQREVRRLVDEVRARVGSLDVLINNAGARFDRYAETEDGIERTFAINHLGHFLLTVLLLECLLAAPSARVVMTGSGAHFSAPRGGGWCLRKSEWSRTAAYSKSKLANIMFAYELARRTTGTNIVVNAVDPGGVASRFASNNGLKAWLKHLAYYALKGQLIGPRKGADTIVHLATDASVEGETGGYYKLRNKTRSSSASYDESVARELWELSLNLSGLRIGLPGVPEGVRRVVFG